MVNSPLKKNGAGKGDTRGFGSIGKGGMRKIWAVGSKNYSSFGIRHLGDDEDEESSSSPTTSAYSYSVDADNPIVLQDQEHAIRPPPPPPPPPPAASGSSDCEESTSGGRWTCIACTFVNTNPEFLSCEVCSQSRTEEPVDTCPPLKGRLTPTNRDKYAAQQTCIQVQKEKIAQVQERALLDERMKEIIEMQQQLLAEIEEEQQSSKSAPSSLSREASERSLQETQTKIDFLHEELLRERSDQVHVELQLRVSQRNLLQQQQQQQNAQVSSCEMTEFLEQERMLRSWKDQWEERRESLTQITEFQKELEDTFSRAFA
jgi:hypothetical protein